MGGPGFLPLEATWELRGVSDMSDVASLRGGLACGRLEQSCRRAVVCVTIFPLEIDRGGRVEAAEKEAWKVCWEGMHSHPCSLRPQHPLCICPLRQQGITTYFSGNCTMEDAKLAQDFLDSQVWGTWSSGWMGPLATGAQSWVSAWAQRRRHLGSSLSVKWACLL